MSLEICILASGSSGNCAVLRTPTGALLIDAGIGPRAAAKRLQGTGVSLADVRAVCLTHLDRDHFNPNWLATLLARDIRVFCHRSRVREALRVLGVDPVENRDERVEHLVTPFDDAPFAPLPAVEFRPVPLAHDREGSHGFRIDGCGRRMGYATDLGRVPEAMLEAFEDVDLLALESNYDPRMQLDSQRPAFLKRRIMGGRGHLSNEQAFEAVRKLLDRAERRRLRLPAHIVLLHRSRQCNCPVVLRNLFSQDPRIAPRLTLAEQSEPTPWLRTIDREPLAGEQLSLGWG